MYTVANDELVHKSHTMCNGISDKDYLLYMRMDMKIIDNSYRRFKLVEKIDANKSELIQ